MTETIDDSQLLHELEPTVEKLLGEHLEITTPWYPHEFVPYDQARSFESGYQWQPEDSELPEAVGSALFVNLLTEDNLPHYFNTIDQLFGPDGAWGAWSKRWTAEEGRHSIVIRDYLTATRAIDPVALEDGRMRQVSGGEVPAPGSVLDGLAYVSLQELATRVAHRNTGKMLDEAGEAVMQRVAKDENYHYIFYRGMTAAALELEPSAVVLAIHRQVANFQMPGTGIPNFNRHAKRIALSGIYGFTEFTNDVVRKALTSWKIADLEGLSPEAEAARHDLLDEDGVILSFLNSKSQREQAQREAANAA